MRLWLNDQFCDLAFNTAQQEMIVTTSVNISTEEVLEDKVFFLSREETQKAEYFPTNDDRLLKASDYTRASGVRINAETGNGAWWTRTFNLDAKENIWGSFLVFTAGETHYFHYLDLTYYGVVPVLTIDFS